MNRWVILGIYNIRYFHSFFWSLVRGLGIMIIILSAFFIFSAGVNDFYNQTISRGHNAIFLSVEITSDLTEQKAPILRHSENEKLLSVLNDCEHLLPPIYYAGIDFPTLFGELSYKIPVDRFSLQIAGELYYGENDNSYNFDAGIGNQPVYFDVDLFLPTEGGNVFPENKVQEFMRVYNAPLIITGREMHSAGEVMMSSYMLERFGISDGADLIGKQIFFEIDGKPLFQATLTGILNPDYFHLFNIPSKAQIILMANYHDTVNLGVTHVNVCYEIDDYENSASVWKQLQNEGVSDDIYFNEESANLYYYIVRVQELINSVVKYAVIFLVASSFVNLCSLLTIQLKHRSPYYAMCNAMGMSSIGIFTAHGVEIMSAILMSSVISCGMSAILIYALNSVANMLTGISLVFSTAEIAKTIGLTSLGIGFLTLIVSALISTSLNRTTIAHRLREK